MNYLGWWGGGRMLFSAMHRIMLTVLRVIYIYIWWTNNGQTHIYNIWMGVYTATFPFRKPRWFLRPWRISARPISNQSQWRQNQGHQLLFQHGYFLYLWNLWQCLDTPNIACCLWEQWCWTGIWTHLRLLTRLPCPWVRTSINRTPSLLFLGWYLYIPNIYANGCKLLFWHVKSYINLHWSNHEKGFN